MEQKKIALIGAGLSNLGFLYSINPSDPIITTLYERSKVIGGRAATRTRNGFTYDNGANYLNATDSRLLELIKSNSNLKEINKWIYPFDKNNNINFDNTLASIHNEKTKYTFTNGIKEIANLLYTSTQTTNFKIEYSKDITNIIKNNERWELYSNQDILGEYDYVIFGIPTPNILRILKNNEFFKDLTKDLEYYKYKKIYSLAIAYDIEPFNDYYALINSDREHPISWISVENEKRNDIKDMLFIVQMSNEFSMKYFGQNQEDVLNLIINELSKLIPKLSGLIPTFTDLKMWGHALPEKGLDNGIIEKLEKMNLYVIGDCILNRGRIDGAIITGFDLYNKLKIKF